MINCHPILMIIFWKLYSFYHGFEWSNPFLNWLTVKQVLTIDNIIHLLDENVWFYIKRVVFFFRLRKFVPDFLWYLDMR